MSAPLGSGLGAFPAGVGPAGHDPEDDPSEVVTQAPVEALYFDPYDRVYTLNDDLSVVAGSGPIQRAAHLMLPQGSLPATPNDGFPVDDVRRAAPNQRLRAIEDALRVAWKPLLEAKQIRIGIIELEKSTPWSGRFYVEVTDLVTKQTKTLEGRA